MTLEMKKHTHTHIHITYAALHFWFPVNNILRYYGNVITLGPA